jgi:hypothetical protein
MACNSKVWARKRLLIKSLISVGFFLLFIAIFMEVKASQELDLARKALPQSGEKAIKHYFQALNWYAPWGSSQKAAEELLALANKYKSEGQTELAYSAFLRLRAALYAARSFYSPRRDILAVANEFLANYLADKKISLMSSPESEAVSRDDLYLKYFRVYSAEVNFSEFFAFIVVLSFLGWVFFFVKALFALFGEKEKLTLKDKINRGKTPIVLFFACYLAWYFSMMLA